MSLQRLSNWIRLCVVLLWLAAATLVAAAAEHHGQVTFGGLPVPGATVTVTQGSKKFVTATDLQGIYFIPELADGAATIQVEMLCFATVKEAITVGAGVPASTWPMTLLPLDQMRAVVKLVPNTGTVAATIKNESAKAANGKPADAGPTAEELAQRAADGLLVNGSVNNAATSQYTIAQAFGNNRPGGKSLYNGGIGMIFDNSALDARPYSLSGQDTPKASYNRFTGIATFGGPIRIPHVLPRGPNFFVAYQWTRNRDATILSALVPDAAMRSGDFSQKTDASGKPLQIFNPATGQPYAGGIVPINPQAQALLNLYPLANLPGNSRYNYQIAVLNNTHQDALQSRLNKTINAKNQVFGDFGLMSSRSDSLNLFRFLDKTKVLGFNSGVTWSHRFNQRVSANLGYRFSRLSTRVTPYWQDRRNVSGEAGIGGNNQEPMNWGPPSLNFSGGVATLSDAQSSFIRNRTDAFSLSVQRNRGRHNVTLGGDFRWQQFNYLSQQDPRGTFAFTGAATRGSVNGVATGGSDFADFLVGVPDSSSIATGNADKYLRQPVYDAYIADDWRVTPQFTLNVGARWEYGAPITELKGRLVNLDVASGFSAVAPVLANDPVGLLTGQHYPDSLVRPDRSKFQPRVGLSWRPIPNSSMVVRAGYGIYADTSVYQATALQMAQQSPLSKSLSVQNGPLCPLSLANAFQSCPTTTANTFAVDPNFRTGYAQNWQVSVQRDLPASLQLTATYLGIKGTRGVQEFLPNSYPVGGANPCTSCPSGFAYLTSNGNSTREAGDILLRRRLHNGLTASLRYTYSKSIDNDAALGGQGAAAATSSTSQGGGGQIAPQSPSQPALTPAQNWRDLKAERGLSTFDQRHLVGVQVQYTTGMGMGGNTLLGGWRGTALKEWAVQTQINAGTGLPQTPGYLAVVPGTGFTCCIRPNRTGADVYAAPAGYFLNPAAYTAPAAGQWGNAGRGSITGPGVFTWNASLARTFRLKDGFSLDARVDSTNVFNHVNFTRWNTTTNNTQFGLPIATNPMRSLQTTIRLRF